MTISLQALALVSVALALGVSFGASGDALRYADDTLHYRLAFPVEWNPIPQAAIDERVAAVTAQSPGLTVEFRVGFQQASEPAFAFPYVLIQHLSGGPLSLDALARALEREQGREIRRLQDSGMFESIAVDKPIVDRVRNMVRTELTLTARGADPVSTLTVSCPGRAGVVQIHLYAPRSQIEATRFVFEGILDSFSFDSGYEYAPPAKSRRALFVLLCLAIGALAGAGVWGCRHAGGKKQEQESNAGM